jgi:hypothetical protein
MKFPCDHTDNSNKKQKNKTIRIDKEQQMKILETMKQLESKLK